MGFFLQAVALNNCLQMFDLRCLRKDNNGWRVRLKRTYTRTVPRVTTASVRKVGISLLIMGLALSASAKDATGDAKPSATKDLTLSTKGLTKPADKRTRSRHWFQVGLASWYGTHFQGRTTAAGERFDMNQMTCAHPSLPMGTWLRVTNLKNRKTTFVRVNDRGPVVDGRIVDLSFAAAQTLGLVGVGQVRLEAVRNGDPVLAKALVAQLQIPELIDPLAR